MTTVAVMQPYFIPYAGYFRLFAQSDLVVLYDCVQFPRRGFVHRNRLPDSHGDANWLTLPLAKASRDVRICDLEFAPGAAEQLRQRAKRFPCLAPLMEVGHPLGVRLFDASVRPVDYISGWLHAACTMMGLPFHSVRSSELQLPTDLRGQDRVLAIARHFGANCYLNSPGGRQLYDEQQFAEAQIRLAFLPDYQGPNWSILYRLLTEDPVKMGRLLR